MPGIVGVGLVVNDPGVHVTWDEWTSISDADVDNLASRIAEQVGDIQSIAIEEYSYAGQPGRTARFTLAGTVYGLVPGGEVAVGFDPSSWVPTPDQLASYRATAEEYGLRLTIHDYIAQYTSPRRIVTVPTLLVAVEAAQAGLIELAVDNDRVLAAVDRMRARSGQNEVAPSKIEFAGFARVLLNPDWTVRQAWQYTKPTLAQEMQRLASLGRQLLTPDEWEHACGAGAPTLFRWGNDYPAGSDPWTVKVGPHRDPNRFGLHIAEDPYLDERTADPNVICGGDGGGMVHGGAGQFVSWLTIATAYRDQHHARFIQERGHRLDKMLIRPAIDLSK